MYCTCSKIIEKICCTKVQREISSLDLRTGTMSHCVLHLSRCTGRKASLSKYLACRYSRWSSNSSYLGKARERRRKEERATSTPERFEADDIDPYGHPRLPLRGYYEVDKCDTRREWVERFAGAKLHQLGLVSRSQPLFPVLCTSV